MALTFPGVSAGGAKIFTGQYPLQRSTIMQTGILRYTNGSEQRWKNTRGSASFSLQYEDLSVLDKSNINAFVGQVAATEGIWTFGLNNGQDQTYTFPFCEFMEDSFTWTESGEGLWAGTIRFRQFGSAGLVNLGTNPQAFPHIAGATAIVAAFPFSQIDTYMVDRVEGDNGTRTAYCYTNKGFSDFPSRPLRAWEYTHTAISNKDLAKIEDHFVQCGGGYIEFPWTDPEDHKVYSRVRYDSDSLEITHIGWNLNQVKLRLAETYGPGWVA